MSDLLLWLASSQYAGFVPYLVALFLACSFLQAVLPPPAAGSHFLPAYKLMGILAANVGYAKNLNVPDLSTWVGRVLVPLAPAILQAVEAAKTSVPGVQKAVAAGSNAISAAVAVLLLVAVSGCGSVAGAGHYATQSVTAGTTGTVPAPDLQDRALADQKAALAIATAAADRAAIQCAAQGVAIETNKAVGPLSAAMKADQYLQMAAIDCKAMNTAAVGNALTLAALLAAIGL